MLYHLILLSILGLACISTIEIDHLYDVIILGGGAAGFKAAQTLSTNGVTNILLLEAQEQIGGRIKTIYLDNNESLALEYGANWIHGIKGNPLYDLVKNRSDYFYPDIQAQMPSSSGQPPCVDFNGKEYDPKICSDIDVWFQNMIENLKKNYPSARYNSTFEDYFKDNFKDFIRNETDDEMRKVKYAYLQKSIDFECISIGCKTSINEVSLDEYGSYSEFDSLFYIFPGGYIKLINFLAEQVPKDSIKINSPIEEITRNGQNLKIRCKNGDIYNTKHIVVTCSLAYLQKHYKTLFGNGLFDSTKVEAMNKLRLGCVPKIYFEYDNITFFTEKTNTTFKTFALDYTGHKDDWIYRLSSFTNQYNRVLRLGITGNLDNLENDELNSTITEFLRQVLNDSSVPVPKNIYKASWCSNPYILGTYSFIPVGGTVQDIIQLSKPVYIDNSPKIVFAGEALHEKHYSTVLGAYLTGETGAMLLVEHLKDTQITKTTTPSNSSSLKKSLNAFLIFLLSFILFYF